MPNLLAEMTCTGQCLCCQQRLYYFQALIMAHVPSCCGQQAVDIVCYHLVFSCDAILSLRRITFFYNKFSKWDNMVKFNGYLARWHLHEKTECSLHNINFALKYIYILTNIWITANCKPVAYKDNKYLARKWIGETIRALILILLTANYRPVWIGQRWSCRLQF